MSAAANKLFVPNQEDKREWLSQKIAEEQQKFLKLAQQFYDEPQRSEKQCLGLTEAILAAIDNILAAGDWESSLFLRSTIKPLRRLREEVSTTRDTLMQQQGMVEIQEYQLAPGEIKVYVSLYQADGHSMDQWEAQLASIDCYMAGRPIYCNEQDIQKAMRQKLLQVSEAYAVVVIDASEVIQQEFAQGKTDRYGHALASVEAGVVDASNVIEFVHLDKRYHYYQQRLVLKSKEK